MSLFFFYVYWHIFVVAEEKPSIKKECPACFQNSWQALLRQAATTFDILDMSPPCSVVWDRVHSPKHLSTSGCLLSVCPDWFSGLARSGVGPGGKGVEHFTSPETTQKLMQAFTTLSSTGDAIYRTNYSKVTSWELPRALPATLYCCWWGSGWTAGTERKPRLAGARCGAASPQRCRRSCCSRARTTPCRPQGPAPGIAASGHTAGTHLASCQSGWSQTLTAPAEVPPLEALLILTRGKGREETMKVPVLTSQLLPCSRSLSLYTLQHES